MGWSIHHPVGLIHYTPTACQLGYSLFSTTRGGKDAYLIDMQGNVVHRWHSEEGIHYAYLLDNGNLLCRTMPPKDAGGYETVGGSSASIIELDWGSNLVWAYRDHTLAPRLPATAQRQHPAAACGTPLPDGPGGPGSGRLRRRFRSRDARRRGSRKSRPTAPPIWEWRSWEHLDP